MQSSSLLIYIQLSIIMNNHSSSFIINQPHQSSIICNMGYHVIRYQNVQLIFAIIINHNHYWSQSSSSTIVYQLSIAVYTINNNYHESSMFNHYLSYHRNHHFSRQHSIIIINHGNRQQALIIGLMDGCWSPILLHIQCNIQSYC